MKPGVRFAPEVRRGSLELQMAFQQAQIPVQKLEEFEQLKQAIGRIFAAEALERFYKKLQSKGVRVREFERAMELGIFEPADSRPSGKTAKQLYGALALSDQALIREFYLERIEQVDARIREKFKAIYCYY